MSPLSNLMSPLSRALYLNEDDLNYGDDDDDKDHNKGHKKPSTF